MQDQTHYCRATSPPVGIAGIAAQEAHQAFRRSSTINPMTETASPPISSHRVFSVGEPVKKRENSELKDSDAFTP